MAYSCCFGLRGNLHFFQKCFFDIDSWSTPTSTSFVFRQLLVQRRLRSLLLLYLRLHLFLYLHLYLSLSGSVFYTTYNRYAGLSISDNLSCNFLSFCLSASTSLSFNSGTSTLYQFLTSSQTQRIFLYRKVLLAFDSLSFCER